MSEISELPLADAEKIYFSCRIPDFHAIFTAVLTCLCRDIDFDSKNECMSMIFLNGVHISLNLENRFLKFNLYFTKSKHSSIDCDWDLNLNVHSIMKKLLEFSGSQYSKFGVIEIVILNEDGSSFKVSNAYASSQQTREPKMIEVLVSEMHDFIPIRRTYLSQPMVLNAQKSRIIFELSSFSIRYYGLEVKLYDFASEKYIISKKQSENSRSAFCFVFGNHADSDDILMSLKKGFKRFQVDVLIASFDFLMGADKRNMKPFQVVYFNDCNYTGSLVNEVFEFYKEILSKLFSSVYANRVLRNFIFYMNLKSKDPTFPIESTRKLLFDFIEKQILKDQVKLISETVSEDISGAISKSPLLSFKEPKRFDLSTRFANSLIAKQPIKQLNEIWHSPYAKVTDSCNALGEVDMLVMEKSDLSELEALGQLDNKFIVCFHRRKKVLYAVDQHAADERIRLEDYERSLIDDPAYVMKRSNVSNQKGRLGSSYYQITLLENVLDCISLLGLRYSAEENSKFIRLYETFDVLGHKLSQSELQEFLLVDTLPALHLISYSKYPYEFCLRSKLIHRILCSKACRGAIMFGDKLTLEQCTYLISKQAKCKLPFQCAHGRPSIAPLLLLD
jgi:hypothetical protein